MKKIIIIIALAACSQRGPKPLSHTVDATRLASVPLEAKEEITQAQQRHELALAAKVDLATEARDAAIEEDLATHQARHGYVVSIVANRDPSAPPAAVKPDALDLATKAADAKLEFMRARRALIGELAAWATDHALAAQAKLELARAKVAQQNGIAVDVPAFERQAEERDKAVAAAKAALRPLEDKAMSTLTAWDGLDEKTLEASGLRGPLESKRYALELGLLTTDVIAEKGLRPLSAIVVSFNKLNARASASTAATDPQAELDAALEKGIKKIDDTTYELSKDLVERVLLNPMAVAKGARVVPAMKDGKPDGFKLYAIRPVSVFAKLGFLNGDTLQRINGFELTSADKALEAYTKLREATNLEVEITRRGQPVTLKYTIR